jgi:enamine deaminase RidA (YjgF/YER057c/UK114 family)
MQFLANLSAILYEAESKIDHVILTAVYISDVAAWPVVSAIYAEVFGDLQPAHTIIPCNTSHQGLQIEIDTMAVLNSNQPHKIWTVF